MYLVLFLFLIFKIVNCQLWVKVYTIHACEGHNLTLYCNNNDEMFITIANYGRMNYKICQFFEKPIYENEIKCGASNTTTILRNKCNGISRCIIETSNSIFGDPCPGEIKYLETSYFCRKPKKY